MQELKQYISANPRNKIAFCHHEIEGFDFVDIGYELSMALKDKFPCDNISGKALDELNVILNNNRHEHHDYGMYIAITNIAILLEPELKLDIENLFEQYSKLSLLIVNTNNIQLPLLNITSIQI